MAVQISWGNEHKTFTVFEFIGTWTWEEYYAARDKGVSMVNSVDHTVNIIVDISQSSFFPQNMLTHFRSSVNQAPRPFDLCVIVSQSRFVEALVNVLSRLKLMTKFRLVKTRDEALEIFRQHDVARPQKAAAV